MIIGHLPAGYVTAKILISRMVRSGVTTKTFLFSGVLGAIAPDFDMLYFHLIDNRQNHHHSYWPHFPMLWLILMLASLAWYNLSATTKWASLLLIFSINGLLHMMLDSIVGDIRWFAPFSDRAYAMFTVRPLYTPWWLNFILHWSFALELAIWLWAFLLWRSRRESP